MIRKPLEACHIAVEGPIGVGKTTLARRLADHLASEILLEELDGNPFIELFYENPERHALAAQLSFLFSRLKQWQGLHQQQLFSRGLVSDYIFAKDRLFATVTLSDAEYALYDQVARLVSIDVPRPDLVIYIQADLDVLTGRLRRRDRRIERRMTPDYLREVAAAYERFFFQYQEAPLLVVRADHLDFANRDDDVAALVARIRAMRSEREFWADYS